MTSSSRTSNLELYLPGYHRASLRYGCHDDGQVAEALGINRLTVWRVRTGRMAPGPRFVAGALRAWPEFHFEQLFTVIDYVPRHSANDPDPAFDIAAQFAAEAELEAELEARTSATP